MMTVLAAGVFDVIHPGHIYFLEQSKKLGDRLVVVVTSDETAETQKRHPFFNVKHRLSIVQSLRSVDLAVIGQAGETLKSVIDIKPDVIAIGHDQFIQPIGSKSLTTGIEPGRTSVQPQDHGLAQLGRDLAKLGWRGKIVRIDKMPGIRVSSSRIKKLLRR